MRKNILITGASSGLGWGMAHEFASRGCNLALCARRQDRLEALRSELQTQHAAVRVSIHTLDVCDHDAVFTVFETFRAQMGSLDRVVVNAGVGQGAALGTGHFKRNAAIAQTNFVAALAQFEAALQIFRAQKTGHLVAISSVAAMRGLPGNMGTYAASKAALATLSEGVRIEFMGTPIAVTTLYPGFIRSEMTAQRGDSWMMADADSGARALVEAIESEAAEAFVPAWPWGALGPALKRAPAILIKRVAGRI